MNDLRDQIYQATNSFLATIRQLTQQHTEVIFRETFSSLGAAKETSSATPKARGAKRGADELEHLSQRFTQFVHANPGLRIEQINKQLGTTTTELALPIRKLIASGTVTVKGEKRSTTYFAAGSADNAKTSSDADSPKKDSKKRSRPKKESKAKAKAKSKAKSKS